MMIKNDFSRKASIFQWGIAQKIILCVLIFSSVVTVFLISIQLYISYRGEIDSINQSIRLVEESYLESIKNSLWVSDTELLQTQLKGMMKLSDMQYIDVTHNDEILAKAGILKDTKVIMKKFDLPYIYRDKTIPLGTLRVIYTLENIYDRLAKDALGIIIFQSIIIFLVSGFIFLIFYLLVVRYLYALVDYTRSLKVDTLRTPFILKQSRIQWGKDELDALANTINEMRINLNDSYSQLKEEIVDRKQTQEALRESEAHLLALIDSLPDLVWLKDSNGIYLGCNSKFERFFGAKKDDIIGKTDYDFVDEKLADFFRKNDEIAMAAGKPSINEEKITYADDGHTEFLETIKCPMYNYKGKLIGILGVGRDITERKKEEEEKAKLKTELQHAQKMESIGILAGGIAHDFNNIMAIILGNTELALEDVPKSNPAYSNLEEIKTASRRAKNIVRQLLSYSRVVEQEMQSIKIGPVIKDGLKFLRSTIPSTIDIEQNIQLTDETILADPTQINQILMNLCINASQAMEQTGGDLNVAVEKLVLDNNSARNYPGLKSGDHVRIIISDTGPGIDPEIIDQIFDPYFTTKEIGKGSGMGLAVVHGIVKSHSGAIAVESSPGKGTKFITLFPLTTKKPMVETKTGKDIPGGNETILFVDDEKSIVKMLQRMFERLGYKVQTATTPEEALERFRSNPDHFDLVITDMTMPQMTGVKLSEKLMDIRKDIPIIVCTGHSALVDEEKAKELGLAAYIIKPIDMQETAQIIRKILDKK